MKMNWIGKRFFLGLGISFLAALLSTALYKIILLFPLNYMWTNVISIAYIYAICLSIGVTLIQYQKRLGLQ